MATMRLNASHLHRYCHSRTPPPSPRNTYRAPRHLPLPTLLLPPSATSLFEHRFPNPVLRSPPHTVPASTSARNAAGCYRKRLRRHAVNHAEHAHGQRPPQWRRARRNEPRRRSAATSVSIATNKKRVTNAQHSSRHCAQSHTPGQAKPLRTSRNCGRPARDSSTATPLVFPAR